MCLFSLNGTMVTGPANKQEYRLNPGLAAELKARKKGLKKAPRNVHTRRPITDLQRHNLAMGRMKRQMNLNGCANGRLKSGRCRAKALKGRKKAHCYGYTKAGNCRRKAPTRDLRAVQNAGRAYLARKRVSGMRRRLAQQEGMERIARYKARGVQYAQNAGRSYLARKSAPMPGRRRLRRGPG